MTEKDFTHRLAMVKKYGMNAFSSLLLYDDITAYSLKSTDGFVGYSNSRKMLVVIGEPVCAPEKYLAATEEFIAFCKETGKGFMFVTCGEDFRNAVRSLSFSTIRIGVDFIFDVATYAPRGDKTKMIRLARNHAMREGAVVKEYDHRSRPDPQLEETFKNITRRWLAKNNRFKAHIMNLNLFDNRDIKRYFYAEVKGQPKGFIVCLPIFGRKGLLLEDAVRDNDAPYGTIELITLVILDTIKQEGGKMATFGLSPKLDVSSLSGASRVIANIGVYIANPIFSLNNLYHFRKKFCTTIAEPSYLMKYPEGLGVIDLARLLTSF
jgi:phosphatidylglycerol lysyltransferase